MLNLINNISDDKAEYLHKSEETDVDNVVSRHMDLFIEQSGGLIALGYINNNLVWFSSTNINDLFLTRRVFDCMRVGNFYRKTTLSIALSAAGLIERDLERMYHVGVHDIEKDKLVFTGCLVNQSELSTMTGVDFAKIIAVLPMRIKAVIPSIGSDDDILTELENDYAALNALYVKGEHFNHQQYLKALTIRQKWQTAECLKLSDRAAIRVLYHDICYHVYSYTDDGIA